jgi:hypothetical protein
MVAASSSPGIQELIRCGLASSHLKMTTLTLDRDGLIEGAGKQVHAALSALGIDAKFFSLMCLDMACMKSGGI